MKKIIEFLEKYGENVLTGLLVFGFALAILISVVLSLRINALDKDIKSINDEITRVEERICGLEEYLEDLKTENESVIEETINVAQKTVECELDPIYNEAVVYLAKTVWGEARGLDEMGQAAVIWCVLNRVDSDIEYFPDDIISVIIQEDQFVGYRESNPATDEHIALAKDVLTRWLAEKNGAEDVGRVLPKEYLYFYGDGRLNHYTVEWRSGETWTWDLMSPYV